MKYFQIVFAMLYFAGITGKKDVTFTSLFSWLEKKGFDFSYPDLQQQQLLWANIAAASPFGINAEKSTLYFLQRLADFASNIQLEAKKLYAFFMLTVASLTIYKNEETDMEVLNALRPSLEEAYNESPDFIDDLVIVEDEVALEHASVVLTLGRTFAVNYFAGPEWAIEVAPLFEVAKRHIDAKAAFELTTSVALQMESVSAQLGEDPIFRVQQQLNERTHQQLADSVIKEVLADIGADSVYATIFLEWMATGYPESSEKESGNAAENLLKSLMAAGPFGEA